MDRKNNAAVGRKQLKIFAAASFLNDFGGDIIYPIWPLFLSSFTGVNMGIIGLIDGIGEAVVSISQAVSGYYSDKIARRKVFVWVGYLCGGISRIGYALSPAWQWLIPFKILDRAGKMRGAPRSAMIADFSTSADRGKNFGFLRTFDNLGAVFGILFSIAFIGSLGFRNLFMIAAIPSMIGAALVFFAIKEGRPRQSKTYKGFRLKYLDNNFRLFLVLSAIFALGSFSYSFLLIFADKYGFDAYQVPVLYLLFTLAASIFSMPFGRLSDKLKSRKKVLAMSFALWMAVCVIFIAFDNVVALIIAFILYGMHKGAIDTVQDTFVSELAPAGYRASSLGGFQLVTGLSALPASLFAGILWDNFGARAPFYLSIFLTAAALALLALVKEKVFLEPEAA